MACPTILPRGKHTATVIFLHGLGDTGHGWLAALQEIALPYVKYMCPNAPVQKVTLNFGMQMPSWFDITSLDFDGNEDEKGIQISSQTIHKLIQEEMKSGIPSERIVIGGFSQGGSVALHLLQTTENKIAGCIGLSTFLSLHGKFDKLSSTVNKDTKIFLGHGDADPVVNYKYGKMTNELLKKFYTQTNFNTYSGVGHGSNNTEMKDVERFLADVLPKQ